MTYRQVSRRSIVGCCLVMWLLSVCYALTTPPFQVPDEVAHYWRAVSLAQGHISLVVRDGRAGSYVTRGARDLVHLTWVDTAGQPTRKVGLIRLKDAATLPFQPEPVFRPFPSLYTLIPYLPAVWSCLVTDVFRVRPLVAFYVGRIFTATVAVVVVGFAMAEGGEFSSVIAAIALLPMALFLFGSYSADAMTIAAGLYTTAVAWRLRADPNATAGTWARLCVAAFLLAMCKGVYAPIALLAIRRTSWTAGANRRVCAGLLLGSLTLGIAVSAIVASRQYHSLRTDGIPEAQVQLVKANPLRFVGAAVNDYWSQYVEYRNEFVGYLGWLDVAPSAPLIVVTFYLLLAVAVTTDVSLTLPRRVFVLSLGVLLLFGVSFSQYIIWTPPGAARVYGIQGRYFLPLAFALLMPIAGSVKGGSRAIVARALYAVAALAINVNCLMVLGGRYY